MTTPLTAEALESLIRDVSENLLDEHRPSAALYRLADALHNHAEVAEATKETFNGQDPQIRPSTDAELAAHAREYAGPDEYPGARLLHELADALDAANRRWTESERSLVDVESQLRKAQEDLKQFTDLVTVITHEHGGTLIASTAAADGLKSAGARIVLGVERTGSQFTATTRVVPA